VDEWSIEFIDPVHYKSEQYNHNNKQV